MGNIDLVAFAFSIIRVMTPLLFASMACMIFNKGGVDSIATEGIMLCCALAAPIGSWLTGSCWAGLFVGIVTGVLLSCLFGYVTLSLKAESTLAGIALNVLATGITIFIVYCLTGEKGSTQSLATEVLPSVRIPLLDKIPILGGILSGHNILTYISLLSVLVLSFFLFKTKSGLRLRTVGENPDAAESVGLSIMKYKYLTLIISGTLIGMGGSFMSMGYVSFFSKNMVAGRGFIGIAAESMGQGMPLGVLVSTLFFSLADALSIQLQVIGLPPELMQLLPYLVTIIAIAFYSYQVDKKKQRTQ